MQWKNDLTIVRFLDSDSDAKSDRTSSSQGTVLSAGLPSQMTPLLIDSLHPEEIAADELSLQWEVLYKYGLLPHADVYQLIRVTDELLKELKNKTDVIKSREQHIDFINGRKIPLENDAQQLADSKATLAKDKEEQARLDAHIKLIQTIPYKILGMIKADPQPLQNRDALLELVLLSKLHNEAYITNLLKYLIPTNLLEVQALHMQALRTVLLTMDETFYKEHNNTLSYIADRLMSVLNEMDITPKSYHQLIEVMETLKVIWLALSLGDAQATNDEAWKAKFAALEKIKACQNPPVAHKAKVLIQTMLRINGLQEPEWKQRCLRGYQVAHGILSIANGVNDVDFDTLKEGVCELFSAVMAGESKKQDWYAKVLELEEALNSAINSQDFARFEQELKTALKDAGKQRSAMGRSKKSPELCYGIFTLVQHIALNNQVSASVRIKAIACLNSMYREKAIWQANSSKKAGWGLGHGDSPLRRQIIYTLIALMEAPDGIGLAARKALKSTYSFFAKKKKSTGFSVLKELYSINEDEEIEVTSETNGNNNAYRLVVKSASLPLQLKKGRTLFFSYIRTLSPAAWYPSISPRDASYPSSSPISRTRSEASGSIPSSGSFNRTADSLSAFLANEDDGGGLQADLPDSQSNAHPPKDWGEIDVDAFFSEDDENPGMPKWTPPEEMHSINASVQNAPSYNPILSSPKKSAKKPLVSNLKGAKAGSKESKKVRIKSPPENAHQTPNQKKNKKPKKNELPEEIELDGKKMSSRLTSLPSSQVHKEEKFLDDRLVGAASRQLITLEEQTTLMGQLRQAVTHASLGDFKALLQQCEEKRFNPLELNEHTVDEEGDTLLHLIAKSAIKSDAEGSPDPDHPAVLKKLEAVIVTSQRIDGIKLGSGSDTKEDIYCHFSAMLTTLEPAYIPEIESLFFSVCQQPVELSAPDQISRIKRAFELYRSVDSSGALGLASNFFMGLVPERLDGKIDPRKLHEEYIKQTTNDNIIKALMHQNGPKRGSTTVIELFLKIDKALYFSCLSKLFSKEYMMPYLEKKSIYTADGGEEPASITEFERELYNHLIKYEKELKAEENSRSFKSSLVERGELDSMTSDPVLLKRAINSLQEKFDLGPDSLKNSHFIRVLLRRKDVNAFFLLLALSVYMQDDCVVSSQITTRNINSKGFRAWYAFNQSRLYGYLIELKNKLHANKISGHTEPKRVSVPYVLEARARKASELEIENKQLKMQLAVGGIVTGQTLETNPAFLALQKQVAILTKEKKLTEKKFAKHARETEKNDRKTEKNAKKTAKLEQQRLEDRNAINLLMEALGLRHRLPGEEERDHSEDDEPQLSIRSESKDEQATKQTTKQSKNRYRWHQQSISGSESTAENSPDEAILTDEDEDTSEEESTAEVSCNV